MSTNISCKMIDTDTGEILASSNRNYALQFSVSNDCGFKHLNEWLKSAVRGIRTTEHKSIEVRFHFQEEQKLPIIFAPKDFQLT